ncbi:IS5 family transposase [Pseudoruegeria sp. SK021]|uniref:IS5 family transposase n=1 Tax=Pseudoruegeria sp. SK021 TaxID=1933035 RepID=UPI000A23A251|nr:IS5 family transposase [Pseudoruegeria sp. SK021]OSP54067.1 IS5 family transposase [Pseudoruegeria sp. SK021]
MPYKHRDKHRDKFTKAEYRVTNWASYNESLRSRGDLTVWISDDIAQRWVPPRRKTRGGQHRYSDLAIEICLSLRVVFRMPLRQTQGFVRSLMRLLKVDLQVPDFGALSRRGKGLEVAQKPRTTSEPVTLIIDSTGLKMQGECAWHVEKHGIKKPRKTWRKLHIAFDPDGGDIVTSELTTQETGDVTAVPELLAPIEGRVVRVIADGAYDGASVDQWLRSKFGPDVEVVIPPPKDAVPGPDTNRNMRIKEISDTGRMAWQAASGYSQRARVEAQIGRWKTVIGDSLQARHFETQKCEVNIATKVLNRMNDLGCAVYSRV